jgi:hypothetical protein
VSTWAIAGVGIAAIIGGGVLLRECWRLISGNHETSDDERAATRAADARQTQFKKTGSYFPPEKL